MNQKKNLTGIATVVLLHFLLLVAFLHGSRLTVFTQKEASIELTPTVEPPKPREREPQVEEPQLARPEIYVPQPPADVPVEPLVAPTARPAPDHLTAQPPTGVMAEPGAKTPQATSAPVVVAAVVDAQACAKPDYPKTALRNGDTGTVMLALLIGTDGKVAGSRVEKSSGFRDLDRAAQAGLSLCKFRPGTLDGVPQQSWTRMQYVWSLSD